MFIILKTKKVLIIIEQNLLIFYKIIKSKKVCNTCTKKSPQPITGWQITIMEESKSPKTTVTFPNKIKSSHWENSSNKNAPLPNKSLGKYKCSSPNSYKLTNTLLSPLSIPYSIQSLLMNHQHKPSPSQFPFSSKLIKSNVLSHSTVTFNRLFPKHILKFMSITPC